MKLKNVKSVLVTMLATSLVVGLTACGGGGGTTGGSTGAADTGAAGTEATAEAEGGAAEGGEEAGGDASGYLAGLGTLAEGLVAEEGAEIEIAYWESSPSDKAGWDLLKEMLAEDHPEINITWQVYPSGDYRDMLDNRVAGGDWPDVIRYTYQRLGRWKQADVMLDLTPYITQENLDGLVPAYLAACVYKDRLVGMPHHTDTVAMYYNKEMFEASGIRIPESMEDAYSWEEIIEIARKLKEDHNLPYACSGIWENGSGYRFLPFLYMNGATVLNEDQTEITINSPEALEALQWYDDMRAEDLMFNNGFTAPSNANNLFASGQCAFDFAGSWHCSFMDENLGEGKWGVTYMPQRNGRTGSDMGGNALFGYAGTEYPQAVAIVIEYITAYENMKAFCEAAQFSPVRTELLQPGVLSYGGYQEQMTLFNEILTTIDPAMAADETSVPFQQCNLIWNEEMDYLAVDRSHTPQQVLDACEERMNEALEDLDL